MVSAASAILYNLLAAAIGWAGAMSFSALWRRRRRRRRIRAFRDFFGVSGQLVVIHSAVLDKPTGTSDITFPVYNYPATDIRASRNLARLFESVGLQEGTNFMILPDIRVKQDPSLWEKDLVLLCGPARNHVFRALSPALRMRYTMGDENGANILRDTVREELMRTSREMESKPLSGNFDYGLVASLPNPNNHNRRLVLLAGVHGTGTVGASEYLTADGYLPKLCKMRVDKVVCEVVQAMYDDDIETPTALRLA